MRLSDFQIYAPGFSADVNRFLSAISDAGWLALRRSRIDTPQFRKLVIRLVADPTVPRRVAIAVSIAEVWVPVADDHIVGGERPVISIEGVVVEALKTLADETAQDYRQLGALLLDAIAGGPPYDVAIPNMVFRHGAAQRTLRFRWSAESAEVYVADGTERVATVAMAKPFSPLDTMIELRKPRLLGNRLLVAAPPNRTLAIQLPAAAGGDHDAD